MSDSVRTIPDTPGFAAQLSADLAPEDVRRVLGVFGTDVARLNLALTQAAAAGDAAACQRVAHSLAGAAGAVGADKLDQACQVLMADGNLADGHRHPVGIAQAAAAIDRLCAAALDDLAAFIARLDGPR